MDDRRHLMDDPRLLAMPNQPPSEDELKRLIHSQSLGREDTSAKKPLPPLYKKKKLKVGKPLPPRSKQKLKNRVLRARARRAQIAAGSPGQKRALVELARQKEVTA
jgi:hypothetical protein